MRLLVAVTEQPENDHEEKLLDERTRNINRERTEEKERVSRERRFWRKCFVVLAEEAVGCGKDEERRISEFSSIDERNSSGGVSSERRRGRRGRATSESDDEQSRGRERVEGFDGVRGGWEVS